MLELWVSTMLVMQIKLTQEMSRRPEFSYIKKLPRRIGTVTI